MQSYELTTRGRVLQYIWEYTRSRSFPEMRYREAGIYMNGENTVTLQHRQTTVKSQQSFSILAEQMRSYERHPRSGLLEIGHKHSDSRPTMHLTVEAYNTKWQKQFL